VHSNCPGQQGFWEGNGALILRVKHRADVWVEAGAVHAKSSCCTLACLFSQQQIAQQPHIRNKTYSTVVLRQVSAGSPILLKYGFHDNANLLLSYGFVLADNPADSYAWPLDMELLLVSR
jgi:hypothetical protein